MKILRSDQSTQLYIKNPNRKSNNTLIERNKTLMLERIQSRKYITPVKKYIRIHIIAEAHLLISAALL